jgi:hypothetical protein
VAIAVVVVTDQMNPTEHRDLFSADQPVTEQMLRERLESEEYSTVQIMEDKGNLIATALKKDGDKARFVVSTKTGKDESLWYDDDD